MPRGCLVALPERPRAGPALTAPRPPPPSEPTALTTDDRKPNHHNGSHGPLRRMLKLIVEIDSSRFLGNRLSAALLLVGILAIFAAIGYGLPALLSRYFQG